MLKRTLRVPGALLALSAAMCWCGSARAAPFVHVSGSGVTGQASLDITNLVVTTNGTPVPITAYTTISSTASSTINTTDPSTSQTFNGPGFSPSTATVTFDQAGGQTYSLASNSSPTSMSAYSEGLASSGSMTSTSGNVQSFYFTAPTAGSYDINYSMVGHAQVDGSFAPVAGTSATADYAFGVDITRQVGSGTPTTTSVALEKGGAGIPLFGSIWTGTQDQANAGSQYTITGVQAGELINLRFYETSAVTATVGVSAPAVPEPSGLLLACLGFVGLAAKTLRRGSLVLAG